MYALLLNSTNKILTEIFGIKVLKQLVKKIAIFIKSIKGVILPSETFTKKNSFFEKRIN